MPLLHHRVMLTSNGYRLDESPARLGSLVRTPASERADRAALWARLRSQGYLWLPGQLPVDEVLAFRRFYFDTLAETGLTEPGTDPVLGVVGQGEVDRERLRELLFTVIVPSPEYDALCRHPAVRGWFAWFLEDDVHLHRRRIIRHSVPGEGGSGSATQAHYDLVYLREGTDRVLSAWIPLGDIGVQLGGLTYLERSHLAVLAQEASGGLPTPAASITADLPGLADERDARWLVADYCTGDIVVHSAHVIHASTDNVTDDRMRLSTDIRYQRSSDPIDWRWQEHWHDRDGL